MIRGGEWAAKGLNIRYIHRVNRVGYKAGALAEGLEQAAGEFIAIFDADFIPPRDMLQNVINYFTDEQVGVVQVRWEHLNRDASLLTQGQAIFLDGHFVIEHTARKHPVPADLRRRVFLCRSGLLARDVQDSPRSPRRPGKPRPPQIRRSGFGVAAGTI